MILHFYTVSGVWGYTNYDEERVKKKQDYCKIENVNFTCRTKWYTSNISFKMELFLASKMYIYTHM